MPGWRGALRPPVREVRFWIVQAVVVGLALAHLAIDVTAEPGSIPAGIPVALLLGPVSYAALRYGLAGSVPTAAGAVVLWLPDLLLPHDEGHVGNDLIELALVGAVAAFVGYHIDAEHLARSHARQARNEQRAAEARYRQLFDTNAAPILVAGQSGEIVDANPAARALFPGSLHGRPAPQVLGLPGGVGDCAGQVVAIATPHGPRSYRLNVGLVPAAAGQEPMCQLVLEDVTEELAEGLRVHRFAGLLLRVQEDERRRIARELHDEPLQLLVQLARALERLEAMPQAGGLADNLRDARHQAVDIAGRLTAVVAGLRPAALEQLGLVPAIRGLLADVAESAPIRAELEVAGAQARLSPEAELAAFRIVQEALNNAVRHAGAARVLLALSFGDDGLRLRVTDDGRGFDPAAADIRPRSGGLGLAGMRERAALVGGSLTVDSAPGRGTTVSATVPAGRPAAEPAPAGPAGGGDRAAPPFPAGGHRAG